MNGLKTALLLGFLSGILLLGGEILGGRNGLVMALGIAVAMNFFSYFFLRQDGACRCTRARR